MRLTVKAYAEHCGLPVWTVRRLCQDGTLPALQVGRRFYIDLAVADKVLDEKTRLDTARHKANVTISACAKVHTKSLISWPRLRKRELKLRR